MKKLLIVAVAIGFTVSGCKTFLKKDENTPSVAQTMMVTEDAKVSAKKTSSKKDASKKVTKTPKQKQAPSKEAAPVTIGQTTTCSKGADVRILEIQNKGTGCVLMYTKAGVAKNTAQSANSDALCKKVAGNIRKTLEASGYVCQ